MSSATVLYINITGVTSEILKNLILAGIKAAIADARPIGALQSTPTSFLPPSDRQNLTEPDAKRAKVTVAQRMQDPVLELNPLLESCEICEDDVDSIADSYFSKFDIVIASNIGLEQAKRIAKATTEAGNKFFCVQSFGLYACALMDLGPDHSFRKEMGKDKLSDVMKNASYLDLYGMMNVKLCDAVDRFHKSGPPQIYTKYRAILNFYDEKKDWPGKHCDEFVGMTKSFLKDQGLEESYLGSDDDLKSLAEISNAEISPVCAVMGGILGNEVIKAISGKGEPANNILMFDGLDGGCKSFLLKSK
jgi:ubiquitin-like 1-activating enzyme E1 A